MSGTQSQQRLCSLYELSWRFRVLLKVLQMCFFSHHQRSTGYSCHFSPLEFWEPGLEFGMRQGGDHLNDFSVHKLMFWPSSADVSVLGFGYHFPVMRSSKVDMDDFWTLLCRTDKSVLASSGFQADIRALQKNLDARHQVCRFPVKIHDLVVFVMLFYREAKLTPLNLFCLLIFCHEYDALCIFVEENEA